MENFCQTLKMKEITARMCMITIGVIIFSVHSSIVVPSLKQEWLYNRNPSYHDLIEILSQSPEPLLTIQPIFAVEAGKNILQEPIEHVFRAPVFSKVFKLADYENMANKACTILLETEANRFFPHHIRQNWLNRFKLLYKSPQGTVLLTQKEGCKMFCKDSFKIKINNGEYRFETGREWNTCSGYTLKFQSDGDLVLFNHKSNESIWSTKTGGNPNAKFVIQKDGNLVIYSQQGSPLWASHTDGHPNAEFIIQADGRLVIYGDNNKPIWTSSK